MAEVDTSVSTATQLGSSRDDSIRSRRLGHAPSESPQIATSTLPPRRSSSIFSDSSAGIGNLRQSFGDSTNDLLHPKAADDEDIHQEPSLWYSLPLLFAILPAITGVAFKRGSVFLTDLALLVLAAIYLNWCLLTPWTWYHSAQSIRVASRTSQADPNEAVEDESALLGDSLSGDVSEEQKSRDDDKPKSQSLKTARRSTVEGTQQAIDELQLHELTALCLCFLGPVLGSYILHLIRTSLSQFGDELVSNMHLTLFVLAAEIRPLRYLMKIAHARTLHLQRVVRKDPHIEEKAENVALQDLGKRLAAVEGSYAELAERQAHISSNSSAIGTDVMRKSQSNLQSQIDALNRAVRRYEKRATAQTIQNEARLQDLETRLKEAVSLAAAAATYSQKPIKLSNAVANITCMLFLPFQTAFAAISYLTYLSSSFLVGILERIGLVKIVRRKSAKTALTPKGVHGNSVTRNMKK